MDSLTVKQLADGTEINGTIKDIDREKGLIEYIKLQDGAGKKHKLNPKILSLCICRQADWII
jgi:hypothetical protein